MMMLVALSFGAGEPGLALIRAGVLDRVNHQ
jgi:hypothetical protein